MWLVVILIPIVFANDLIYLDLEPSTSDEYHRVHNFGTTNYHLESEYGIFDERRPRFHTANKSSSINSLLKKYLAKLYNNKYDSDRSKQQSKLFDNSLLSINKTKTFPNKFLSLFHVVKFPNEQCSAGSYLGTCYHQYQCDGFNGTNVGACGDGYGVCCVFRNTCESSSNQNCTYFENPNYPDYDPPGPMVLPPIVTTPPPESPTPDPRWRSDSSVSCSADIYKRSEEVQQMRIDFVDLELTGPTDGTCTDERLVISGQNINQVPVICGYNTGQHVYVDVSTLSGPLQLSVLSTTSARKRFRIRVCQLTETCTTSNNCLQYFTGTTGVISSFNYDQAAVFNRSQPGYFNNLNYAICIRREAGYCSITYTNVPGGVEYPFQLRNVDDNGQSTVPPGQAGADIFNCPDDYIVIGGVRLCGDKLNDGVLVEDFRMNAPVTDTSAGPIVVNVRTDRSVTGLGFKLFYTQNRCM